MALEVVVLDKDEYKALIDNQADEDELEYLKSLPICFRIL